jgi:hypothetical protein
MKLAIKITNNGKTLRMSPAEECRLDGETDAEFYARIAEKDCPQGATWEVIGEKDFPPEPLPPAPPQPTVAQLQAQLNAIAAQLDAMN